MLSIQPQYLPFAKLIAGRLFSIPEYQRSYSWTDQQREDLFGDLRGTFEKGGDEGHFMAAVVCLRRKKQTLGTDDYYVLDVVDGQQRLTTLIILLKAISLRLDEDEKQERKVKEELDQLLVKPEHNELLLLQTNHDSSHHFANYLRKGVSQNSKIAEMLADREILRAISQCEEFVGSWIEEKGELLSLVTLLKNRLFFLLHEIDDEKSVYTVFEVLNSRGLTVSWLDRLKSIMMGSAFELVNSNSKGIIKELHNTWRDIYRTIGLRQGLSTESLRFAATLYRDHMPSRALGEEDAVNELRSCAVDATGIRDVAHWILAVVKATDAVLAAQRVNAVTRIAQARLLATAIYLRDDFTEHERDRLLKRWEKTSFRIYGMLGYDARTGVGDYVRLAWKVVNDKGCSFADIYEAVGQLGRGYDIEAAVDVLRQANCYEGWEAELRYLMYRYEEHLAKKQGLNFSNEQWTKIWMASPSNSIEHIWPQSKAPKKHVHRLGNLVLLPPNLNKKLKDLPPGKKIDPYRKTGLLIANQVADRIESGRWDIKAINEREEAILNWAMEEWAD